MTMVRLGVKVKVLDLYSQANHKVVLQRSVRPQIREVLVIDQFSGCVTQLLVVCSCEYVRHHGSN